MPFLFERMEHMPKRYTHDVEGRAIAYVLDRLDRYRSSYGACQDRSPKLNIGAETLRSLVVQTQIEVGGRTGSTSEKHAEIGALKTKIKDLEATNENPRPSAIFLS